MVLTARGRGMVVLLATLIGVVATANLGAWQLRRAAQKIALQEALESRIDEIDTQAYFLAEPFLDEAQKALAQKYASAYRLALYNYRDAMKAR